MSHTLPGVTVAARRLVPTVVAALLLGLPAAAPAESTPAQKLVDAYTPVVMVREQQDPPCDISGEQYQPTTVETVLGNPAVELTEIQADGSEKLLEQAPRAADIAGLDQNHHLNLPGDPLGDTCVYARDFAKLVREGKAPLVTYAHLAREQGRPGLAVQYWFFWYFNQFNDLHEGDWEGMQVVFESSDPARALAEGPSEVGLFQHGGGEKANWEDGKVEKEGTHPVVYAAAGSHATFYEPAVYVENGRKGSGVGCDDTSAPVRRLSVRPVIVPTRPGRNGEFSWLTYEGRWGQREKGFNNGPTGPAGKDRWLAPLTWMEEIRSTSPHLPAGSVLGPTVTKAFCGTVADVTSFLNHTDDDPWLKLAIPLAFLLLVGFVAWRTSWGPVELDRLRRRRAFGQLLRTDVRLYRRHWLTFGAIGLTAIPVVGGLTALSWLITGDPGRRLDDSVGVSGLHVTIAETLTQIGEPIAFAIVSAAVIVAMRQLEEDGETGFRAAYAGAWERFGRVVGAQLLVSLLLLGMAITIVGLPFAAWKFVGWLFVQQRILFEDESLREALRGSSRLVRGSWWYTVRVAGFLALVALVIGPVLGFALIFTNLSLLLINAIGALVFALLVPFVAIGRTLLYFDLDLKAEEEPARRWRERLPRRRPAAAEA